MFEISGMTMRAGILSAGEARHPVTLSGAMSKLFCSFLSFCCDQKERNATKERKNAAKTKSGIFLLKL